MASFSGSGDSVEDPILISGVQTDLEAVNAEYEYLGKRYGRKGIDWKLLTQSLLGVGGRHIDKMDIELSGGRRLALFFDITKYLGVFGASKTEGEKPAKKKKLTQ